MPNLAVALILFGVLVIVFPQFIAYLIGTFFILAGANMLLVSSVLRRSGKAGEGGGFRVGSYEVFRRNDKR